MSRIFTELSSIKGVVFDVDGVLSPSTVAIDRNGIPCRMVNIKDGFALQLAVKKGLKIAIISGGTDDAIVCRYKALGIEDIYMGVGDKLPCLSDWLNKEDLTAEEVAYVGDDIPDYQSMKAVGLSVCPKDAATDIKQIAQYISPVDGGYGVARDLLEQILKRKSLWLDNAEAFGW